jgi:hypothetical protein
VGAVGLRSAVAILLAVSGATLLVSSAHAETETTAATELEAPDGADPEAGDAKSSTSHAERRSEQRELQARRWEERFAHVRAVLFDGIELSAEQSRGVDAIIEAQIEHGRRAAELRAELETARQYDDADDTEWIRVIREDIAELRQQRKGPNEGMEEMRALLSEEQRATFDMNRARLAAEGQEPQERRRRRKPRAGAEVEDE